MSFNMLAHGKTSLYIGSGGEDKTHHPHRSPAIKGTATCRDFGF
jgi:hypothetical protein